MRCSNPRPYYTDGIWVCKECHDIQCALLETYGHIFYEETKPKEDKSVCECGSDKTYGTNGAHSEWCRKARW